MFEHVQTAIAVYNKILWIKNNVIMVYIFVMICTIFYLTCPFKNAHDHGEFVVPVRRKKE